MNINPNIFLFIGITFAAIYALVIIVGWHLTRKNRHMIQADLGVQNVATKLMDETMTDAPKELETFSLTNNKFVDADGETIDISQYTPYIAVGNSPKYPLIKNGDLILVDKDDNIKYAFTLPELSNYR